MGYRLISEFENSVNGHNGTAGTLTGGGIYRPGKNGYGLQVAEATTNMVLNPSAEAAGNYAALGSATVSRVTSAACVGSTSYQAVTTAAAGDGITLTLSALTNAAHNVSLFAVDSLTTLQASLNSGTNWNNLTASLDPLTGWYVYTVNIAAAQANGSTTLRLRQSDATARTVVIDAVQVEAKAYRTPFCDGSLGAGHSWSGTAHASTSSRTAATLTYPMVGNIDWEYGSVSMWYNNRFSSPDAYRFLFEVQSDSSNRLVIVSHTPYANTPYAASIKGTTQVNTSSGALTAAIDGWNHVVMTWQSGQLTLYLNGVQSGNTANYTPLSGAGTIYVGHYPGGNQVNGVVDQFAIVDRAITAAEVARIYNGGAGLTYYDLLYALATPATFYVSGRFGADWVDISDYTKSLQWDLGFTGPYEVMARGETLNLALRNADRRFSPENTAGPYYPDFTRNKDIKIDVLQDGVLHTLFYGQIDTIEPSGNIYGDRVTNVQCIGLLNRLQNIMVELEAQENKRADEVIAQILDNCNFAANVTGSWRLSISGYSELNSTAILGEAAEIYEAEPGETTFAVVGDDWGVDTSAYGAIRDVVGQEYGRFFVDRNGQFKFWSRHHFLKDTASVMTLSDKHLAGLAYNYGADVINEVIVSARPRRVGSTNEVLAKLDTPQAVQVRPATTKSITFRYRDSDTGLEIGGKNAVVPQKSLDWFANTLADGSGNDMLADMSATITSETGTSCTVEFANAHATQEAWIQPNAQVRGIKITGNAQTDSKARDAASVTTYGLQRYKYPAALDQVSLAESMARFILSQRKDPIGLVKSITIAAHAAPERLAMVLDLPIGSRVTLTETQTGAAGDYFIIGESWRLHEKQINVQWQLAPANTSYWLLGQSGYAELNSTTILAPL